MPTTLHLPTSLLGAIDRKARALKISRNRLIVRALQCEVEERAWSPGFFETLRAVDRRAAAAFGASMAVVRTARLANRHMFRIPNLQIEDWSQDSE